MTERAGTEVGRLVRLGFAEPRTAALHLAEARLWADVSAALATTLPQKIIQSNRFSLPVKMKA